MTLTADLTCRTCSLGEGRSTSMKDRRSDSQQELGLETIKAKLSAWYDRQVRKNVSPGQPSHDHRYDDDRSFPSEKTHPRQRQGYA
jgi:hypothetical protein